MTKEERHNLYKKALKILPTNGIHESSGSYSLCWALVRAFENEECTIPSELPSLPELYLFDPRDPFISFWLPYEDLQTRQIILDFCIEMTS